MSPSLDAGTLGGVLGPVVTTFWKDEGLDRDAFVENVRSHLAMGLHGVVVCGSSGEAALLDESERSDLVTWARGEVPRDRWLIAGVGGESTRVVVGRAREAERRGADAVLVISPHYYLTAMTREALLAHFRRVADQSPLPVILYNIPKYAHLVLEPPLVAELAKHKNVIGIKDSSGDLELLGKYIDLGSRRASMRVKSAARAVTRPRRAGLRISSRRWPRRSSTDLASRASRRQWTWSA